MAAQLSGGNARPAGGALSRTFLWAYHRSISHAFARSILEIASARVLHETYLAAVVFGPGRDERVYGSFGPVRQCSSVEAIRNRLARWDGEEGLRLGEQCVMMRRIAGLLGRWPLDPSRCCDDPSHRDSRSRADVGADRRHLFIKCSPVYQMGQDLAVTLPPLRAGEPEETSSVQPPPFQHTFLIRRPDKVAVSLQQLENGSESSNTQALLEGDLVETYRLYCYAIGQAGSGCTGGEMTDEMPVIIDADDLLCSPATVMQGYCSRVGLPYDPSMLKWDPGPVLEWLPQRNAAVSQWESGPFANVFRSNGFVSSRGGGATVEENMDRLSKETRAVLERRWDLYEKMHAVRYQPAKECP